MVELTKPLIGEARFALRALKKKKMRDQLKLDPTGQAFEQVTQRLIRIAVLEQFLDEQEQKLERSV